MMLVHIAAVAYWRKRLGVLAECIPELMATVKRGENDLRSSPIRTQNVKLLFWWIGLICLLLIIPVKAIRWVHLNWATTLIVGVAPSLLGPSGLLFLILSSSGRLSRLSLVQITLFVATIALGLEFAQLIPRPAFLARVHYTFDWLDVIASGLSVCVGYFVARLITNEKGNNHKVQR